MNPSARRACAFALLILAIVAAAPALAPTGTDALPRFDDNDDSNGVAAAVLFHSLAVLPSATPLFSRSMTPPSFHSPRAKRSSG